MIFFPNPIITFGHIHPSPLILWSAMGISHALRNCPCFPWQYKVKHEAALINSRTWKLFGFLTFLYVPYHQPTVKPCYCPQCELKILKALLLDGQKSIPASSKEWWGRTLFQRADTHTQGVRSNLCLSSFCFQHGRLFTKWKHKFVLRLQFNDLGHLKNQNPSHSGAHFHYLFCIYLLKAGRVISINLFWMLLLCFTVI